MKKKKDWKIYLPLAVVVGIVVVGIVYWYIDYSSFIKTDDAVVASDVVSVSPKIMGRISKLYVEEGDSVKKGQLLAELDSADMLAQKHQFETAKIQTEANKAQSEAKFDFDQKNIKVLQIAHERAKDDFERAKTQYAGGVITKEQFDHLKKAQETAHAQLEVAQAQLVFSRSQIHTAETAIHGSSSQIGVISTQLINTRLYASCDGIVAKRWLLQGDVAQAGQAIYTINNTSRFWVQVYLEETKIETLHVGQAVEFSLDTYPDVVFKGKITMLPSTTASQFSLIPANNASGNFTKVTQRVPLKVSIDSTKDGKKVSEFHFLTGMSAVVKIIRK